MKRSTFFLRLFGKIVILLLLSFITNRVLNFLFEDDPSTYIRRSIMLALPFIFTAVYYDLRYGLKERK